MKKQERRDAFTAVEISVTVLIIGIIAAIAIPAFLKARNDSRIQQAQADLQLLTAAIRQLAWDTGKWPGGLDRSVVQDTECWDLTTAAAGLLSSDARFSNWKGPYVSSIPLDPWGSPYFFDPDYTLKGATHVVVGSFGPNQVGRNLYDSDDICIRLDDE